MNFSKIYWVWPFKFTENILALKVKSKIEKGRKGESSECGKFMKNHKKSLSDNLVIKNYFLLFKAISKVLFSA